jgi:hypothetical protein
MLREQASICSLITNTCELLREYLCLVPSSISALLTRQSPTNQNPNTYSYISGTHEHALCLVVEWYTLLYLAGHEAVSAMAYTLGAGTSVHMYSIDFCRKSSRIFRESMHACLVLVVLAMMECGVLY